jgi:acetate kinase
VQRRTGLSLDELVDVLNTRSGLAAVSGLGRDLRVIMEARARGHAGAELAVEMYVHTLRKYVGAYIFALGGVHALIFTGGVGENASEIRGMVLDGLDDMGLSLDAEANRRLTAGRAGRISSLSSRIAVLVIPTNEERMIARQADALVIGSEANPTSSQI